MNRSEVFPGRRVRFRGENATVKRIEMHSVSMCDTLIEIDVHADRHYVVGQCSTRGRFERRWTVFKPKLQVWVASHEVGQMIYVDGKEACNRLHGRVV